ncbi:MAG: hypothetical protein AAGM21_01770 [Pseudomonadota bacterium]
MSDETLLYGGVFCFGRPSISQQSGRYARPNSLGRVLAIYARDLVLRAQMADPPLSLI